MAVANEHRVKLVENDTLGMETGWALVYDDKTGDLVCLIERRRVRSPEAAEDMMNEAWPIAADWENAALRDSVTQAHMGSSD